MKTYLDHLPEHKQKNIKALRDLILDEVEKFLRTTSGKKTYSEIL